MLSQDEKKGISKPHIKDVIRERVEQKEAKKRLKQIDDQVEQIRNGSLDPKNSKLNELINHEIAIIDPATLQAIHDTINLK